MDYIPLFANNWRTDLLNWALKTWGDNLAEIWRVLTMSPQDWQPEVWTIIQAINSTVKGVALGLVGVFFFVQVVHSGAALAEFKRPEVTVKFLLRLVLTKVVIDYGFDLILALFGIAQGVVQSVITSSGGLNAYTGMSAELIELMNADVGFWNGILLFIICLVASLVIFLFSFQVLLTVYGRFFKLYMHIAFAPIPLAGFASAPTQSMGISFLKSFAATCMEGACIAVACIIYTAFAKDPSLIRVTEGMTVTDAILQYVLMVVLQMLVLAGAVKLTESVTRSIFGLH